MATQRPAYPFDGDPLHYLGHAPLRAGQRLDPLVRPLQGQYQRKGLVVLAAVVAAAEPYGEGGAAGREASMKMCWLETSRTE